jgi:hypothetical protein
LKLFRADVAPERAGAEPVTGAGNLFGDRVAAVTAAAELLPGKANLDTADAHHGMIGFFGPAHRRAPVRHIGDAGHTDRAAADRAVDAFDAERAAAQTPAETKLLRLVIIASMLMNFISRPALRELSSIIRARPSRMNCSDG